MVKKIDLSVVILNYNTRDLLKRCLESLRKSQFNGFNIETIVVDNASSDQSVKMMKEEFPEIVLISNHKNLGFAAGNNLGIKSAQGEFILLLNPDTEVEDQTLKTMLEFMKENEEVGVATCRVELKNGKIDDASHRGFPTPWNAFCHFSGLAKCFPSSPFFNGYHLGYKDLDKRHEIDSCTGAFMLIRGQAGKPLGWLDEDYFWYGEDLDFCYRVKKKRWKVMYIPDVKIFHWKGASSGIRKEGKKVSTASIETKKKSALASTQAMRLFYQKHYLKKYPFLVTSLVFRAIDYLEKRRLAKYENYN